MASKVLQLNKLRRDLGGVRLMFSGMLTQGVAFGERSSVNAAAGGFMVPGYRSVYTHSVTDNTHMLTIEGQFSADVERHNVLWEMLERLPHVSCLVVYTDLPDHSFNFGPRELRHERIPFCWPRRPKDTAPAGC